MRMPPEGVPKEQWGPGPWQDEVDELVWVDKETGYQCLIKRTWTGSLCGYVGLSEGHRLYGRKYNDRIAMDDASELVSDIETNGAIPMFIEALRHNAYGSDGRVPIDLTIRVHGSVTFTDFWEDREDGLWYWGFDCGHYDDLQPGLMASIENAIGHSSGLRGYGTYRTIEYVQNECRSLARQLKEIENGTIRHQDQTDEAGQG